MAGHHAISEGTKAPDSLIALALAKTVAGQKAAVAAGNSITPSSQENAAPIGPIQIALWQAAQALSFKASGKFEVNGTISGVASAVDIALTATLTRNGVPIGPSVPLSAGHAVANFAISLQWVDERAVGSLPATYGIQVDAGAENTVSVGTDGASISAVERAA